MGAGLLGCRQLRSCLRTERRSSDWWGANSVCSSITWRILRPQAIIVECQGGSSREILGNASHPKRLLVFDVAFLPWHPPVSLALGPALCHINSWNPLHQMMEKCKWKTWGLGGICVKPCVFPMGSGVVAHISVPPQPPLLTSFCDQQAGQAEACRSMSSIFPIPVSSWNLFRNCPQGKTGAQLLSE